MAKREPKNIEEARTLILATVPEGSHVWIYASWSDYRKGGSKSSSESYRCHVIHDERKIDVTVESHLPAQLCRLLIAAIYRAQQPLALSDAPARTKPKPKPVLRPALPPRDHPRLNFS